MTAWFHAPCETLRVITAVQKGGFATLPARIVTESFVFSFCFATIDVHSVVWRCHCTVIYRVDQVACAYRLDQ